MKSTSLLFKIGLLLVLLCSLYVSLWRQGLAVLPNLEHFLSERASTFLNASIELEGLSGSLEQFKPHIVVKKMVVKSNSGVLLAQMQDLRFSVNFWESLKAKNVVFDQIYLSQGTLYSQPKSYVQTAAPPTVIQTSRLNQWLSLVFKQDNIWIKNLDFYSDGVNIHLVDVIQRRQVNDKENPRGLNLVGVEADVTFDVKGVLSQGRLQAFIHDYEDPLYQGRLNVRMKQFDQSLLQMPFIHDSLQSKLIQRFLSVTQGRLWLSWNDFQVERLQLETALDQGFNQGVNLVLAMKKDHTSKSDQWNIRGFLQQGLERSLFSGFTGNLKRLDKYHLSAPTIPLKLLTHFSRIMNRDQKYSLQGDLQALNLAQGILSFKIHQLGYNSKKMQFGPIDGRVYTNFTYGVAYLDQSQMQLHWPKVFPKTFENIQLGNNKIYWRSNLDALYVKSREFHFQHQDADADLNWMVTIPKNTGVDGSGQNKPQLELLADVQSPTSNQYQQYLPQFLPDSFLNWMKNAVVSGHLNHGRFLFHGSLMKLDSELMDGFAGPDFLTEKQRGKIISDWPFQTPPPTLQMNFIGSDLDFQFHEDWPKLNKAQADVLVAQRRVVFDLHDALTQGLSAQGHGEVVFFDSPELDLAVDISGQFKQGFDYLLQSPVKTKVQAVMPILDIQQGTLESELALHLDFKQKPLVPDIIISNQVNNAQVYIKPAQLTLKKIQGASLFSLKDGLTGTDLQTHVLGRNYRFDILNSKGATEVLFKGQLDATALQHWLHWPVLKSIRGETNLAGHLHIPWESQPVTLELSSNLQGFALDMPNEFGKTANETRRWRLAAQLNQGLIFDLYDENHYRARWAMEDGQLSGIELTLGDTLATGDAIDLSHVYPENRLTVGLAELDLKSWRDFFNRIQDKTGTKSSDAGAAESLSNWTKYMPQSAQIIVHELKWQNMNWHELRLSMNEEPGGWRLQWDGPQLEGRGFVAKDKQSPWRIEFDRVDIPWSWQATQNPKEVNSSNEDGPTEFYVPQLGQASWPAFNVEFKDIRLNNKYAGRAELTGEPIINGYHWTHAYGQFAGIHFRGQGSALLDGSDFSFEMKGGRLDHLFNVIGLEKPPLETGVLDGRIHFIWPTQSPLNTGLTTKGSLKLEDGVISGVNGLSPLRWLSLLNAEQFARRLQLDFSGLTQSGLVYDSLNLNWTSQGFRAVNTLDLKSPSIEMKANGWINLQSKRLYQNCVAIIPIMDHLLIPAAAAGGLPAAATAYVLDKALGDQLDSLTELKWKVKGSLQEPVIER